MSDPRLPKIGIAYPHDGEKQLYVKDGPVPHQNVVVRHRMSKELALELLEEYGTGAYFFVVEKLANNSANAGMWRDVLTWLDELRGEKK
jgi:hypothetical protein